VFLYFFKTVGKKKWIATGLEFRTDEALNSAIQIIFSGDRGQRNLCDVPQANFELIYSKTGVACGA